MKSINSDDFFKQVSVNSEIASLDTIKNVYYGMIKTISRELKSKQKVKLPDWGEFNLKIHKSRRFISVNGESGVLPPLPTVKFSPDQNVKRYFHELGNRGL
jgi:nucleoid DNA-binding protein